MPADKPFNNPFADALGPLKESLPESAPPKPEGGDTPASPAPQETGARRGSPGNDAEEGRDDQEAFMQAVGDVTPIDHRNDRLSPKRTAKVGGIDSARELELEEMASLSGFDLRFSDQYIRARAAGVSQETVDKLSRGEFSVRSHLDLHGMILDDAMREVDEFIAHSQDRGVRCVLVVTGKGQNSRGQVGVLRSKIPEWLSRGPSSRRILAFVTARPCDGGEGALYVLLRKHRSGKSRIDLETGGVG